MADVEDLRSASGDEESEDEEEYAYESEASTDPVADAGDQLDLDVARCRARFGGSAERSTTQGSRALIVTLKIDPARSQASSETRQAWGLTAPLSAKLVFSGGAAQYATGYCDQGIAVTAPEGCIVGRQVERFLEAFWRSPVHAVTRQRDPDGLLCATLTYAHQRLGSLADVCAICDAPLAFGEASILPSVCGRPLCAYQLETFGKMLVGPTCLAARADVSDLLVATTRLAARSSRAQDILLPPCVLDGAAVDPAVAARILNNFPSFERAHEIARKEGRGAAGFAAVESALLKVDPRAPACLRWIMTSNKAHLVALPPGMRLLERMAPAEHCLQFIMLSQPPAQQARFAALKARHGSKFAWHGSPAENWHAILRSGLRSASGTRLQLHGAAHGAGVYVSTSLSYSIRYAMSAARKPRAPPTLMGPHAKISARPTGAPEAPTPPTDPAFFGSPDLRIIALCEVAEVPGINKSANIWVVPDEVAVATRFLFVFRGESPTPIGRTALGLGENTLAPEFDREVRARVEALKSARRPVTPAPRTAPEDLPPHAPSPPPAKARRTEGPGAPPKWLGKAGVPRIMSEFQSLRKWSSAPRVYDVEHVGDRADTWRFSVSGFDNDCPAGRDLNSDLAQLQGHIRMEVAFPPGYPNEPFFLRCVSPRFCWYTGHVTAGGAICIEALTTSGSPGSWNPNLCVESILHTVFANFLDTTSELIRTATGPGGRSGPLRVDLQRRYSHDPL